MILNRTDVDELLYDGNVAPIFLKLSGSLYNINVIRDKLVKVSDMAMKDAETIYKNDPAATSVDEVVETYLTYKAILAYRLSHILWEDGNKVEARFISEVAHSITGIDIHPGATIGDNFAIDHGTGIVIGETTKIGNNVVIYQGVTLGAIHLNNRDQVNQKRHPTIGDNVVIYANATILGGETIIGDNSIIGANTFITKSVEPNSVVYYNK